jgi:hypothetical protein
MEVDMGIPGDPFSNAKFNQKPELPSFNYDDILHQCYYCKYHSMIPAGRVGDMKCTGNGDIRQRSTMQHNEFNLSLRFNPSDAEGECSKFKRKDYANEQPINKG